MELMLLECMTHLGLYVPKWKLVRRWSHIKNWGSFLMHIITHIAKRILKYLPLECIAVDLRLFCHFIINLLINLFSPKNLFKADFSQNANNFHQEKNFFLSYDCTVIFSGCLCSFLSLGFFLYFNIVKFWKGTTPRKGVLLATAYFLSWWLMQVKCYIQ